MKNKLLTILMMSIIPFLSCISDPQEEEPIFREGYVDVPGGKIWYRMAGIHQKGTPLLVLHGGPGVPHDYLKPLEALTSDRPVIFYDQLGCGYSDKPNDTSLWTTSRFVEEVKLIRSALKLTEVHILGQSWGTMLAVEYMLREHPSGVKSLILSAPYLSTPMWMADQQMWINQLPQNVQDTIHKYETLQDFSSEAYQEALMIFYNKHVCRMDPWPDDLLRSMEKMGAEVYHHMWGPSEFTMTGTLMHTDLTNQLSQLSVPTLLTAGEFDEATPTTTQFYQSKISGAEIHIFPGASHSHHLESETEYLQVVKTFLGKHP